MIDSCEVLRCTISTSSNLYRDGPPIMWECCSANQCERGQKLGSILEANSLSNPTLEFFCCGV